MDRVEKEIDREKKLHKLEKKKASEFKKRKKEKLRALNEQLKSLENRIVELQSKSGKLKRQKASLNGRLKNLSARRKAVSKHLLEKIKELKDFFSRDFPSQREKRMSDLEGLEGNIKEGAVEPEEGMSRLFTILQSAISMGYDCEVYSGYYTSGEGKSFDGKYLRLGAVISTFVSLDGEMVAYLIRKDTAYTWIDRDLDLNLKQNIKKAVRIAEGKSAPELVPLPFGALVTRGGALND
jgi:hypothetical protein